MPPEAQGGERGRGHRDRVRGKEETQERPRERGRDREKLRGSEKHGGSEMVGDAKSYRDATDDGRLVGGGS